MTLIESQINLYLQSLPGNPQANSLATLYPITRIDDAAILDVLINEKIPEQQFFNNLKDKEEVVVKMDANKKLIYEGFGKLKIFNQGVVTEKKVDFMGILVQDYHISKVFSLIEGISTNGDKTNLSIFYVNPNIEESLFIDELTWYAEEKKINLGVLVETAPDGVPVLKGKLQKNHISDYMPPVESDSHILIAGSNEFQTLCVEHLKTLGFASDKFTLL